MTASVEARVCAHEDCITLLSRSNASDRCAQHARSTRRYAGGLPSWAPRGNCASAGERLGDFFPEEMREAAPSGPVLAAKRICASCPVIAPCLGWVLEREDQKYRYGVFGMLTGPERTQIARAADPLAAGLELVAFQVRQWPDLARRVTAEKEAS